MLYVLTGSDVMKAKARVEALAKGYDVLRFGEGGEPFTGALSALGARGLFGANIALLLDRPSEDADGKTLLAEHAAVFAGAGTPVIVIEPDFPAAAKKKLPAAAVTERHDIPFHSPETPTPSVFELTDAFAGGDRKEAWMLYRRLIENGSAAEEIHGALSWQARALVLASKTNGANEAGLKPFVYAKAKRAAVRLGEKGAEEISRELVRILHASRTGGGALEDLLEAFLLKKA